VPLAPTKEEPAVDIVAFSYEERKGGENFEKKRLILKVKREERSLQKLKDTSVSDKSMTFTNTLIRNFNMNVGAGVRTCGKF